MTKPIERIYVTSNNLEGEGWAEGWDANPESAERFRAAINGTTRVFTEERPWITDRAPDSSREVEAVWASGWPTGPLPRLIIAVFGSEGKWCAVGHDLRRTILEKGTVLAWRELPELKFPAGTTGTHWPTGWR